MGAQGSTARPVSIGDGAPKPTGKTSPSSGSSGDKTSSSSSATPDSSSPTSPSGDKSKSGEKSSKRRSKKKQMVILAEEDVDIPKDPVVVESDDIADNEFLEEPPRRRSKPKKTVVPEDEDPEDFWNGVSKSKTKEKKKEIKKLQQSLESMTINLKSSWKEGSSSNQQQRFAVMINDIGIINTRSDACAGHKRVDTGLQVRLAFAIDLAPDKASGCGIDTTKWLYVEMTFPDTTYLREEPKAASKTLSVRQCPPMSTSDEISSFSTPSQFGLWWTIEQRLSTFFKTEWASIESSANKAAKVAAKDGSVAGASDAWAMLEILEWPPSQLPLALKALSESKNDVKMALELVLEESWLEAAKVEVFGKTQSGDKSQEVDGDNAKDSAATKPSKESSKSKYIGSGFLELVISTITTMINDAGKYCPICAEPHPLELFKPIVCGNELCKFQFSNLGLGVDFESELLHSPMAVDLLISMTAHAVQGTHFEPFPHEVSTKVDGITHALKIPEDVGRCLVNCPSVDEMVECVKKGKLRARLAEIHPLLYLLLRWIVTSSRAHLHFLTGDELVPQIDTPHQFHLKSTPPEREQKFYAAKKKYGSFYAWHGSATSNWHSILRNGLKNYSNSRHQVNGAAYGPGVYMAVDSGTSIGYSWRSGPSCWANTKYQDGDLILLALCEVINEGEFLCTGNVHRPHCLHCTSAPYYRIEKDEYITTRYLFVVSNRNISVMAADIQSHLKTKQLLRSNKTIKTQKKKDATKDNQSASP